jgi:hypothetical protein
MHINLPEATVPSHIYWCLHRFWQISLLCVSDLDSLSPRCSWDTQEIANALWGPKLYYPCTQDPVTVPYSESYYFSPCLHNPLLYDPVYSFVFQVFSFLLVSLFKLHIPVSFLSCLIRVWVPVSFYMRTLRHYLFFSVILFTQSWLLPCNRN